MKKIHFLILPAVIAGVATLLGSGVSRADDVFVSNNGTSSIEEIVDGSSIPTTFVDPTSNLSGPTGVAIYNGILYVANNSSPGNGFVAEYSATTPNDFLGDYAVGLNNPRGIVFDPAGNLYVANQSTGTIVKIPVGSPLGSTGSVLASGFSFPNGLAFSNGNLYAANAGGSTIEQITTGGVVTTFATGVSNPNGIAFSSNGHLFVMNNGTETVLQFDAAGNPLGAYITDPAHMDNSKGLAIDSQGNFYVTDEGDNSVTEYGPAGNFVAVFSTGFSGPNYVTTLATVPEPTTYALLLAGLGMLLYMRRRKTVTI